MVQEALLCRVGAGFAAASGCTVVTTVALCVVCLDGGQIGPCSRIRPDNNKRALFVVFVRATVRPDRGQIRSRGMQEVHARDGG